MSDYVLAHMHSANHREEVLSSDICGCFYCCQTFPPTEIYRWYQNTAVCPLCDIDAVLGSKSGFPITSEFLKAMRKEWFTAPEQLPMPPEVPTTELPAKKPLDELWNNPAQFIPAVVSRQVNALGRPNPQELQTTECKSSFWTSIFSRVRLIMALTVEGVKKLPGIYEEVYEEIIGNRLPNAPKTRFQWWMKHLKMYVFIVTSIYCTIMFVYFDQYIAFIGCGLCGFFLRRIRDNNI